MTRWLKPYKMQLMHWRTPSYRASRGPFLLEVKINLKENWISVLDTGIGMASSQVCAALAPSISFKDSPALLKKRKKAGAYARLQRGWSTFLAYGTDRRRTTFETKRHSHQGAYAIRSCLGARGARRSTEGGRGCPTLPLEKHARGTYIEVHFSGKTLPKSLVRLSARPEVWEVILRTRTAIGQVLLTGDEIVKLKVRLEIKDSDGVAHDFSPPPSFLFPHEVKRSPVFRFMDLVQHYKVHPEKSEPAQEKLRHDGLYMVWDRQRIQHELLEHDREQFEAEIEKYTPSLYSFMPYQGSVWGEMNGLLTGEKRRSHLYPGLWVLAVNRQRLADAFEIAPSRFEDAQ